MFKRYYLANSPIITKPGVYFVKLMTPEEIKNFAASRDFIASSVRHRSTAQVFSDLLGIPFERVYNGGYITPQPGECVIYARPKPGLKRRGMELEIQLDELEFGVVFYMSDLEVPVC